MDLYDDLYVSKNITIDIKKISGKLWIKILKAYKSEKIQITFQKFTKNESYSNEIAKQLI